MPSWTNSVLMTLMGCQHGPRRNLLQGWGDGAGICLHWPASAWSSSGNVSRVLWPTHNAVKAFHLVGRTFPAVHGARCSWTPLELGSSQSGRFHCALVCADPFTKWLEVLSLKRHAAASVSAALVTTCTRWDLSNVIMDTAGSWCMPTC